MPLDWNFICAAEWWVTIQVTLLNMFLLEWALSTGLQHPLVRYRSIPLIFLCNYFYAFSKRPSWLLSLLPQEGFLSRHALFLGLSRVQTICCSCLSAIYYSGQADDFHMTIYKMLMIITSLGIIFILKETRKTTGLIGKNEIWGYLGSGQPYGGDILGW